MVNEFFYKGAKKIWWEKNGLFAIWSLDNWICPIERMNLDPYLTLYIKMNPKEKKKQTNKNNNSKWVIYLNVEAKIVKFLKENIEGNLNDLEWFLDIMPKG